MLVAMRVHLAGRICLDLGDRVIDEGTLAGSQGRLVFAMLVAERRWAVSKDEIAEELWGEQLPSAWENALRALISKIRAVLARAGCTDGAVVAQGLGCYQMSLPAGTWVDLEAAADAVHRAEAALRVHDATAAQGHAAVALAVSRRPLLAGHEGRWVTRRREMLQSVRLRALDCSAAALIASGDAVRALVCAQEAVHVAPFRERGHRLIMRAHLAAGDRAEALRSYERLRSLLAEELGVPPARESECIYEQALS